jgi:hypothetical protein
VLQAAGKRQAPPVGAHDAEELRIAAARGVEENVEEDVSRSFNGFLSAAERAGVWRPPSRLSLSLSLNLSLNLSL